MWTPPINELKFNDYMISFLPGLCYEVLCDENNILEFYHDKEIEQKTELIEETSNHLHYATTELKKVEIKTDLNITLNDQQDPVVIEPETRSWRQNHFF